MDGPVDKTDNEREKKEIKERLSDVIEKSRVLANLELLLDKRRLMWNNFLAGLAKGVGFGLGLSVLAAVLIYLLVMVLKSIVALNIPLIGNYIADLVQLVQDQMQNQR
jgi:hypothetical protein